MLSDDEVSIIICHHTGNFINMCVESVRKSYGVNFEIIIVTSDNSLSIDNCKMIYSNVTPAEKRNLGAYYARGMYLCFLDDDVTISPSSLYNMMASVRKRDVGMVFGKLWNMQYRNLLDDTGSYMTNNGFLWSRAGQLLPDHGQFDAECNVLSGKSAMCVIKTTVFNLVGGFDEGFGILGEETDLAWRVWLFRFRVVYNPKATGYHAFNTDYKPVNRHYTTDRVQYNGCRNYITMLLKNLEARNLWRILPVHVLIWSFVGFAMLITGKLRQGWAVLRGIGYVIRNWEDIISRRKWVQAKRKVGDSELFLDIWRKPPSGYYVERGLKYLSKGLHG